MKTILTICMILLGLNMQAQSPYPKINIWDMEKDTVLAGDSLYVGFKYSPPGAAPYYTTCGFQIWGATYPTTPFLWQGSYLSFSSLPKYSIDSLSKIYLTIPSDFPTGIARIYTTGGTPAYVELYVISPVGINELQTTKKVKEITYFNISGQQIDKSEKGLKIKQTTFSDNTVSYSKECGF